MEGHTTRYKEFEMTRTEKFTSTHVVDIYGACVDCLDNGNLSQEDINSLKNLSDDDRQAGGGWTLGEIAAAVLDIHNIEKYSGENKNVYDFIRMWNE
jgi:hypothetical protein